MQHIFESIKGISPPCRIPVKFADAIFGIISGKDDVIDKEKKEYGKMENLKERFIFRNILPEEADQAALIEKICFPPMKILSGMNFLPMQDCMIRQEKCDGAWP